MNELDRLKNKIRQCDAAVLEALLERNKGIEEITLYKKEHGLPFFQREQEMEIQKWLKSETMGKAYKQEIEDVFFSIYKGAKKIQAERLLDQNIFLIGFMGCGKSTVADFLNRELSMEVIEMDQIIAKREGMSISDIFEVHGEAYFRELETKLLKEMESRSRVVVSCGGGTPMRECNVAEMKKSGCTVLLTACPETVLQRTKDNHDRPLLEKNKNVEFIAELMEKRREKYEAAADIIIETDGKNKKEICEELVRKVIAWSERR